MERIFSRWEPKLISTSHFSLDFQVDLLWNKEGTSLLVKTALEVDTTGESYYGEQNLHYMSIKGDSAIVTLCKYNVDHSDIDTVHKYVIKLRILILFK